VRGSGRSHYVLNRGVRDRLLGSAANPEELAALAFAGIIAMLWRDDEANPVPVLGLSPDDFRRLATRWFGAAGAAVADAVAPGAIHPAANRLGEFADLLGLLLDNRTSFVEESRWLAHAVATASLGENHLWQDLGLPNRPALSRLLAENFAPLALRNTGDMRWKKFFYKQLCERSNVNLCKAPSCSECVDYLLCFGPEDADFLPPGTPGGGISGWCATPK